MEKTEEHIVFCDNVRRLRLEHGLSKKEMAHIMGIGVRSLSTIESGVLPKRLRASALWNLSVYFKKEPKSFFVREDG